MCRGARLNQRERRSSSNKKSGKRAPVRKKEEARLGKGGGELTGGASGSARKGRSASSSRS